MAEFLHKSKAWVSKHLAIADGLNSYASQLLDDGVTEDLETLKAISAIEALTPGTNTAWALCQQIRRGKAGRTEARETLAAAKDAADPVKREHRRQEQEAKFQADVEQRNAEYREREAVRKANDAQRLAEEKERIEADPHELLWKIERELECEDGRRVYDIIQEMRPETLSLLAHHLEFLVISGTAAHYSIPLKMHAQCQHTVCEMAAFMAGTNGEPFELGAILRMAQDALQNEEG